MTARHGLLVALALLALTAAAMAQSADGPKVQLRYTPADLRTDKDVIPSSGSSPTIRA